MNASMKSVLALLIIAAASLTVSQVLSAGGLSFDNDSPSAPGGLSFEDDGVHAEEGTVNQENAHWFTIEYEDLDAGPTFALLYGIPESDAVLFSTSCVIGSGGKSVEVDLMIDHGGAVPNQEVEAVIKAGSKSFSFPARVFADSDEFAGIRMQVGRKSPVWSALAETPQPQFGIEGSANTSVASAEGAGTAIAGFKANCLDDAVATAVPAVKVPVLDIPATAPGVVVPRPAATSKPGYLCDDGSMIGITFGGGSAARVANVSLASGQTLALAAIAATFGEKYSDGSTTLRVSGANAQLTTSDGNRLCTEQ